MFPIPSPTNPPRTTNINNIIASSCFSVAFPLPMFIFIFLATSNAVLKACWSIDKQGGGRRWEAFDHPASACLKTNCFPAWINHQNACSKCPLRGHNSLPKRFRIFLEFFNLFFLRTIPCKGLPHPGWCKESWNFFFTMLNDLARESSITSS